MKQYKMINLCSKNGPNRVKNGSNRLKNGPNKANFIVFIVFIDIKRFGLHSKWQLGFFTEITEILKVR